MRQLRPRLLPAVVAAVLSLALGTAPPSAGEPPAGDSSDANPSGQAEGGGAQHTITLITGDVVRYQPSANGAPVIDIDPAPRPDGREVTFHSYPTGDGFVVLPDDAAGMVASGRIDRDLFDLPTLVEERAGDAGREIPLLIEEADSADPGARSDTITPLSADAATRSLNSIDASAIEVPAADAAEFWAAVNADVASTFSTDEPAPQATDSTPHVWLDRTVTAALDVSVGQIGAPAAWDLGLDGAGVKVAVLDTGIDPQHPDFAGRIAATADFTGSGVTDRYGHGTHVAGIVLGDGAASDGGFTGVAPGADLLVGKVLGDDGSGSMSQIIAGMEWAVAQGADIVNLSLGAGGGPTDGSDPMSRALDTLAESSGTLFVVAAGNAGAPRTVFSPGAATRALTVGAVDSEDVRAEFSSHGPRGGDAAVKPNIVAPGVAIGSARATGTDGPEPIDQWYTRASGTSMAAPHVAGAAALIAQQRRDWGADEIRDALVSTAVPDDDIWYAQGGGRVDVAAAVTSDVFGSASLDFGWLSRQRGMRVEQLTFTNAGDQRVTLELSVDEFRGWSGAPGPAGAVALGGKKVTIPAGDTRSVTVRVDPKRGEPGAYGGFVTAESADGDVRLTMPFSYYTGASSLIEVSARGSDGSSENVFGTWVVLAVSTGGPISPEEPFGIDSVAIPLDPGGYGATHLADGEYQLIGLFGDFRRGRNDIVLERVSVTSPQSVVLDASTTVPAAPHVPEPVDVRNQQSMLLVDTARADEPFWLRSSASNWPGGIAVTPQAGGSVRFMSQSHSATAAIAEMRTSDGEVYRPAYDVDSTRRLIGDGVTMEVVAVGAGDPADYAGLDVAGKAVVIAVPVGTDGDFPRLNAYLDLFPRAGLATGMGAAAVVAYLDHDGDPGGYVWNFGAIPVLGLSATGGRRLAAAAADGSIELTIDGNAEIDATYRLRSDFDGDIPDAPVELGYDELVQVQGHYHADSPGTPIRDTWGSVTADGYETLAPSPGTFTGPVRRTEYIGSTRDDVTWLRQVEQGPLALRSLRTYAPADRGTAQDEHWFKAPLVPGAMTLPSTTALPPGFPSRPPWLPSDPACALCRDGDRLVPALNWLDSDPHHAGDLDPQVELFRGDTAIPAADGEPVSFVVPDDTADYRFVASDSPAGRPTPELVTTVTEFTSGPPSGRPDGFACAFGDSCEFQPAPQLRYELPLDLLNRAEAGAEFTFEVTGRTAAGEPVEDLSLQYSTDGGATWADAGVSVVDDGRFGVVVDHPSLEDTDGYVALRATATDAGGGTVDQTIVRAYALR